MRDLKVLMEVTAAPLTLEQFLGRPEQKPALEFADRVITEKVAPQGKHSALQVVMATSLDKTTPL